ncbi:MAG TPA: hypothetical protein VIC08_13970 [Cellvibrionaceae bacterium]
MITGANLSVFDEALTPQILEAIETEREWYPESNGFVLLYGFSASQDETLDQRAQKVLKLAATQRKSPSPELSLQLQSLISLHPEDAHWLGDYSGLDCQFREKPECFEQLIQQVSSLGPLPPRTTLTLERYRELLTSDYFLEPPFMVWDSPLPNFDLVMKAGFLTLSQAYIADKDAFLDQLTQDMHFWRLALNQSQSILSKMVANAVLHRDLAFLSHFLRTHTPSPEQHTAIAKLLTPLSESERDISESFYEELRVTANSGRAAFAYYSPSQLASALHYVSYQPKATLNDYYQYFIEPALNLAKAEGPQFVALAESHAPYPHAPSVMPPSLFNLAGKLSLKQQSAGAAADYIGRMHDLVGIYRLVHLQLLAKSDGLEQALREKNFANPFTLKAIDYDKTVQKLSFSCFKRPKPYCSIQL